MSETDTVVARPTDRRAAGGTARGTDADAPAYTRLNVNIGTDVAAFLRDLTKRRRMTITEGVRRALLTWKLVEETLAEGGKVELVDSRGRVRELVFL
jgi:hypothetical protein